MIVFRPHRETLKEAMKEVKCFDTEDELKEYICKEWQDMFGKNVISKKDVIIQDEAISDKRIGWIDSRYVCIKRFGKTKYKHPAPIGMCATKIDDYITLKNLVWGDLYR